MGERTTVNLPFAEGLAQQEAIEWQDSGASASGLTNGNFTKQGAVDKRLGMQHLPNTLLPNGDPYVGALTNPVRTMSWSKAGLSIASPGAFYDYSSAGQGVSGVGYLPPLTVARSPLPSNTVPQAPGVALVPFNGKVLRVSMYLSTIFTGNTQTLNVVVSDASNGTLVAGPIVAYTGAANSSLTLVQVLYMPLAPAASQIGFCVYDYTLGNAYFGNFNLATNAASITHVQGSLTDVPDLALYDGYAGGGALYIGNVGGTMQFIVFNSTFSAVSSGTLATGVVGTGKASACGNAADTDIVFAWCDNGSLNFRNVATSTLTVDGAAHVGLATGISQLSGICRYANGFFLASWWTLVGSNFATTLYQPPKASAQWSVFATGGSTGQSGVFTQGLLPVAAPFIVGSTGYQPVYLCTSFSNAAPLSGLPTSSQGTLYLMQLPIQQNATKKLTQPVATVAPRQVDLSLIANFGLVGSTWSLGVTVGFHCPHVGQYTPTGYTAPQWFACGLRTIGNDVSANSGAEACSWAADFHFDSSSLALSYQPAELGGELYLSGSTPFMCDGTGTFEVGFFEYPEYFFAFALSGGGTWVNPTNTAYQYACVIVQTDDSGTIHRSAPQFSPLVSVTQGGTSVPALVIQNIPSWRTEASPGQLFAEVYRNIFVSGVSNGEFYLVDRVALNATNYGTTYTTYVDSSSVDSVLQTASILYTTGGILDCVCPPAFSCLLTHKSRLWGVDETGTNIWFTKRYTPGIAPGFNEALTLAFSDKGPITGLFSMDDKLIIGKASGLWVVYGDGPADTGQGNDLTIPQPVACDAGPVDWRAGVVFPGGLIYRSATGFMLCDRGLNVSWIGRDVVDSLNLYPTVLSATVVPTATQVRFVCANASGQTITLVFDYLVNKWLTHSYPFQSAGVASSCLASVVAGTNPSFAAVTSDGYLWLERQPTDSLAYYDDDTSGVQHFNPTSITTAWCKIQGVQGFQRARQVQLLFEENDDCGVTMGFAFNYTNSVVQTYTWPSIIVDQLPLGAQNVVQMYVGAQNNLQMAIQVTVSDTAGTVMTNGKGARFIGLSLDLEKISDRYMLVPSIGKA